MQRPQRIASSLAGLGLAGLLLWRSAATLERSADGQQSFAVIVDQTAPVVTLGPRPGTQPVWRGRVRPTSELERVGISIDGVPVGLGVVERRDADTGELELSLSHLARAPGWHFVELTIERRGGRRDRVVDPVLIGRFEADAAAPNKPCAASFTASPQLVREVVTAMLEAEVLPALRENEHMGPETKLSKAELELRDDVVRFELLVEGVNTLAVSGVVAVAITNEGQLWAELVTLGEVDFRGKLRNSARGVGAGGGALIGGLIAGPLAPVGAAAGFFLADKFVTKKARELVREQIDAGLEQLAGVELLPPQVELVPGRPASRVALGFCEQTGVRSTGLVAGLWIEPAPPASEQPRFTLGVPSSLITGATPTIEALEPGEDLRVELTIDLLNALLREWTQTGLLSELIGEQRALERANEELEAWTPLRLRGLVPTRPPTLTPLGGSDTDQAGWAYGLGGLAVELDGVDEQPWGRVFVAGAGTLSPSWDPEAGELSLVGSLDRLELTCARPDSQSKLALEGCFSEVLEAAEVRERIDARLRPGASNLPTLALHELLADELGLRLDELAMSRPRPGVLRLSASLTLAGR